MEFLRRLLASEPAIVISVVAAGLALAVAFGVHISDAQADAIKNFVTAVLAFAAAVTGIRQTVYAPATVERMQGDDASI